MSRRNEKYRWARGLDRKLVATILELEPDEVKFVIGRPVSVRCIIRRGQESGTGVAICSVLDLFDERDGKAKAAGRAVAALVKKQNSHPIRASWDSFPNEWTKRQIDRIRQVSLVYRGNKSIYVC